MSSNALLWPSQGTKPEERLDKYKYLRLPSQGVGGVVIEGDPILALFPPLADATFQFYKFYQINKNQAPSLETDMSLVIIDSLPPGVIQEASGKDIRVFDSSGLSLDYERVDVTINPDTSADIIVWFDMAIVKDLEFVQLTFGKPTATDEQNAAAVWSDWVSVLHMDPSLLDSTGAHNGINNGTTDIVGKIGRARNFDGVDDFIDLGNFDLTGNQLTLCAWVNSSDFVDGVVVGKANNAAHTTPFYKWLLFTRTAERLLSRVDVTTITSAVNSLPLSTFVKVDTVYTGTEIRLFINGVFQISIAKTSDIESGTQKVYIGGRDTTTQAELFSGAIDEVGISNNARSDDYIKTQFNNQNDNDVFWFRTPLLENGVDNFLVDNSGNVIVAVGN